MRKGFTEQCLKRGRKLNVPGTNEVFLSQRSFNYLPDILCHILGVNENRK